MMGWGVFEGSLAAWEVICSSHGTEKSNSNASLHLQVCETRKDGAGEISTTSRHSHMITHTSMLLLQDMYTGVGICIIMLAAVDVLFVYLQPWPLSALLPSQDQGTYR